MFRVQASPLTSVVSLSHLLSLSPCGHLACLTCLFSHFTQASSQEPDLSQIPQPSRRQLEIQATLSRKKICPICRETVKSLPTQVWSIKSIARHASLDPRLPLGGKEWNIAQKRFVKTKASDAEKLLDRLDEETLEGVEIWKSKFRIESGVFQQIALDMRNRS